MNSADMVARLAEMIASLVDMCMTPVGRVVTFSVEAPLRPA